MAETAPGGNRASGSASRSEPGRGALATAARWLVVAVAAYEALAIGGVHEGSQLALAVLGPVAAALALVDGARPGWLAWLLAAETAWCALALVPLPGALVHLVSPLALDIWRTAPGARLGPVPLSLEPPATARMASQLAALTLLYFGARHAAVSARGRQLTIRVLGGLGALEALIGLAQGGLGLTKILGVYPRMGNPFAGTFVDRNHGASLMAAGLCACAASAAMERLRTRRLGWAIATAACGVCALATLSRGGAAAIVGGLAALWILWNRQPRPVDPNETPPRRPSAFLVMSVVLAVGLAVALMWEGLVERTSLEALSTEGKVRSWWLALRMATQFPLAGIGRGAFATVFERWQDLAYFVTYTHPENEIVQVLCETGFAAGAALVGGLAAAWLLEARRRDLDDAEVGALAALAAIAIQNLADFGLELPGVAASAAVLLGVATGRRAEARGGWRPLALAPLALAPLALAPLLVLGVHRGFAHSADRDFARLRALPANATPAQLEAAAADDLSRHPADYVPAQFVAERLLDLRKPGLALPWLNRTMLSYPFAYEPHFRAAQALAALGARDQALLELRLAWNKSSTAQHHPEALRLSRSIDELARAFPDTAEGLEEAADTAVAGGRSADGLVLARRAVERSRSRLTVVALANALSAAGRDAEAVDAAWSALDLPDDPANLRPSWAIRSLAAQALSRRGQLTQAEAEWRKAVSLSGGRMDVAEPWVVAELAAGRGNEALEALQAAAGDREPARLQQVRLWRAQALLFAGRPDAARIEAQQAVSAKPADADAAYWLARALAAEGRADAAVKAFQAAARLAPPGPLRAKIDAELARLAQ